MSTDEPILAVERGLAEVVALTVTNIDSTYAGGSDDFITTPLQQVIDAVEAGTFRPPIGRVFPIDEIVEAHRTMEGNAAGGKIVVVT